MKNTETLPDRAIFQYESEPIFQRPLRYEHVARVASIRNTPAGIRITGQLTVDGLPAGRLAGGSGNSKKTG